MKKLSYEGFARIYFRLSKGKMKKEKFDDLLRYTAVCLFIFTPLNKTPRFRVKGQS